MNEKDQSVMPINTATWKGRSILDPEDVDDLETRAAIHEFHSGDQRHNAEDRAYVDYRRDKLFDAGAHHLRGIKAAHAIGDTDTARKHGVLFALALKQLGHEDVLNPPKEIKERSENSDKPYHSFKAHPGDFYSLPKEKDEEKKTD